MLNRIRGCVLWAVGFVSLIAVLLSPRSVAHAMAKESGIGMTLTVDDGGGQGRAITNDVTSVTFGTPRAQQDVTGLDKSAMERLLLLADFTMTINFVFNDTADTGAFQVFKSYTSNSTRTVVLVHSSQTLTAECVLTDVSYNRGQDGSLTGTATLVLANGTAAAWS